MRPEQAREISKEYKRKNPLLKEDESSKYERVGSKVEARFRLILGSNKEGVLRIEAL